MHTYDMYGIRYHANDNEYKSSTYLEKEREKKNSLSQTDFASIKYKQLAAYLTNDDEMTMTHSTETRWQKS